MFLIVLGIIGLQTITPLWIFKRFFPLTDEEWWFASTYFVMYLLHPYINIFLRKLEKANFQKLLLLLIAMWSLLPTLSNAFYQSNNFIWFITLYCVAAYIREFGLNPKFSRKHYIILFVIASLLRYSAGIICMFVGTKSTFVFEHAFHLYSKQSFLTLLSSLFAFMIFEKTNIGCNKHINRIASATFGVYLLHDHPIFGSYIWKNIFHAPSFRIPLC